MRFSEFALRLNAALAVTAASSLVTFFPACAQAEGGGNAGSMFGDAPSISKPSGGLKSPVSVSRLPDGSVSVEGPIHSGKGVNTQIVIPKIQPNVRFSGPAGVDENGNPISWQKKRAREIANGIVFQGLKAQGYSYEEFKKKREGVKTQADIWREKTEATRKHIEKYGPITTKEFVIPGSTPEVSAKLNSPEVGVRMEDGRRVYYLNGERIDPYAKPEKKEASAKASPATREATHAKLSKRIRAVSEEDAGSTGAGRKGAEAGKTAGKTDALVIERNPSIQRTAPKTAYQPDPEEDLRRSPLDIELDPNEMPKAEDVERQVREMFPDMSSLERGRGAGMKNAAAPASGPLLSDAARFLSFLFGISDACASETETGNAGNPDGNLRDHRNPSPNLSAAFGFSPAASNLPSIPESDSDSGADSESDSEPAAFASANPWAGIGVPASRVSLTKEQNAVIDEITKQSERLRDHVIGKHSPAEQKSPGEGEAEGEADSEEAGDFPTLVESVMKDGAHFDPAEFAADVVNKTQSLTPEQFSEDAAAVASAVSGKDGPGAAADALAALLESNPEIYTAIPDADLRLQERQGIAAEVTPPDPLGEQTFIFISYSLKDAEIRSILERQKERKDVTLVMRGVPDGMNIPDGIKRMQDLTAETGPSVPVIIDPVLFREYGITRVPAVVRAMRSPSPLTLMPDGSRTRRTARMVAKAEGLDNDEWLREQIEAGERGDLGQQGNTQEIAEPDLIEEMKRRVALIDWQKKKEEALKRFWKNQTFRVFPTADKERLREIDPTILVERDITDLAGRKIRSAGDRVNPLQIRPFTQTMIVFNPLSEKEMARVEAFRKSLAASGGGRPVLIATQMEKKADWDGYVKLTDRLDSHVYLMTPDIEYQWRIEKTPAVITADNRKHVFLVRELGPAEEESKE